MAAADEERPLAGVLLGLQRVLSFRRKIGRTEGCTHLSELLGPAVTTLFQTMSHGDAPEGQNSLETLQNSGKRPFFIGGCHSWRTDGPVVADKFPQFATKPAARD